jgi:hypothetical protein
MKIQYKITSLTIILLCLVFAFLMQPAGVAFAGITPTATSLPPTDTPVPPPTATPAPPNPDPQNPPAQEATPVPTPGTIPDLGAGPGARQIVVIGTLLLHILAGLAFAWWRLWRLYRQGS